MAYTQHRLYGTVTDCDLSFKAFPRLYLSQIWSPRDGTIEDDAVMVMDKSLFAVFALQGVNLFVGTRFLVELPICISMLCGVVVCLTRYMHMKALSGAAIGQVLMGLNNADKRILGVSEG